MKKKLLAMVLVVALSLTLLPVTAFAGETADYTVIFAMPKEYVGNLRTELGIKFCNIVPDECMASTNKDITIDGVTYTIFTTTTGISPKAGTNYRASSNFRVYCSFNKQNKTSFWYSENDWKVGENFVTVPTDLTKMKEGDTDGRVTFLETCTVSGNVTDNDNNPIEGATVSFKQTSSNGVTVQTTTDSDGNYELAYVPANKEGTFSVSKDSYDTSTSTKTFTEDTTENVELKRPSATYTVSFNPNGGTGTMDPQSFTQGKSQKLSKNEFTKEGYTFSGWMSGAGTTYTDGQEITVNVDMTLNAMWTQDVKYTLTIYYYDKDIGAEIHDLYETKLSVGTPYNVESPEIKGYTPDQSVVEGVMPACDVSEQVYYKVNTYNITYKDEGDVEFSGTHEQGYPTTHTYGTATKLDTPKKTGYTFDGYYADEECETKPLTELSATGYTDNITLYAKWTISSAYKDAAKAEINKQADTSKNNINAMTHLSSAGKESYKGKVDVAKASATAAIDAATTVGAVDDAKAAGIKAIEDIEKEAAEKIKASDFIFTAPSDLTYDGTDKAATVTGKEGMGTITVKYATSLTSGEWMNTPPVNAGTYYVKACIAEGTKYAAAELTDAAWTFTIKPAKLQVTLSQNSFVYNGKDQIPAVTVKGVEGETLKADDYLITFGQAKRIDVGTYTVKAAAFNNNYEASDIAEFTITQAPVTVTARDASKIYGKDDPAFTADVKGTLGDDKVNYTVKRAEGKDVGTYAITPAGDASQGNYYVTYVPGTFTITKAKLTISLDKNSFVYNGKDQIPAVTVKGVEGEILKADDYQVTFGQAKRIDVGTYTVKAAAFNNNYEASDTAEFTITQAPVTVTAKDASKEYGAKDPALTAEVKGTVGTDTVKYMVSRTKGEDAGAYTITPAGDSSQGNYKVTYVSGTFTVNPAKDTPAKTDTDALAKIQKEYQEKNPGKEVSVEMQVSEKADASDVAKIQEKAGTKKLVSFDASLVVKVDEKTVADAGSSNKTLVSTTYKFDFANKSEIQAFRVHEGSVDELTTNPNADGEYVKLDKEAGTIIVVASKYSTYAFAYKETAVPATGDSNNMWLYILIAALALGAAAGAGIAMRRKTSR